MEQNLTKKNQTVVNILIYSCTPGSKTLPEALVMQNSIKRTKEFREFAFTVIDDPASVKNQLADLLIITDDDATANQIVQNSIIPAIRIETSGETVLNDIVAIIQALTKLLYMNFTVQDFVQIHTHGIPAENIQLHLRNFKSGIAKIKLDKPATLLDGIYPLTKAKAIEFADHFDRNKDKFSITKFVPASGAASRMFKFLNEFLAAYDPYQESINAYINHTKDTSLSVFLVGLDKFPFFKEIVDASKKDPDYITWSKDVKSYHFIKTMLQGEEFNFSEKPKGIIPFHKYENFTAVPVYEHLKECVSYAFSQKQANLHLTISQEHREWFLEEIEKTKGAIEREAGITINFSYSYQQMNTDTLAVDGNNMPFREGGKLLFRPGGHGALLQNLNALDADIVFIKNIDNVSQAKPETIALYKKALAGMLIQLQEQVFTYLDKIYRNEVSDSDIAGIFDFAKAKLYIDIPADVSKYTLENKIDYAAKMLNRPIRICGMVKNEGEPGGGPFWTEGSNGRLSLQIVESSQIDLDNKGQKAILKQSTHFNPVDLVCGLKDYNGNAFDLTQFTDPSTGFIVYKNKGGKDVKSYELPGLWNGAMAGWITIFSEVPLSTFNPVKTVNDLLKPAHQPQ